MDKAILMTKVKIIIFRIHHHKLKSNWRAGFAISTSNGLLDNQSQILPNISIAISL